MSVCPSIVLHIPEVGSCPSPQKCFPAPPWGFQDISKLDEMHYPSGNLFVFPSTSPQFCTPVRIPKGRCPGGILISCPNHLKENAQAPQPIFKAEPGQPFWEAYFSRLCPWSLVTESLLQAHNWGLDVDWLLYFWNWVLLLLKCHSTDTVFDFYKRLKRHVNEDSPKKNLQHLRVHPLLVLFGATQLGIWASLQAQTTLQRTH